MLNRIKLWLLRRNIKKRGIVTPVIVTQDGCVVDGNHRVFIALELGIPSIPVICIPGTISEVDPAALQISCHPVDDY